MCGIHTSANCLLYDFVCLVNLDVLSVAQIYTVLANTDPLQPDNVLYTLNIGVYKHCLSTLCFVGRASRYNRVKKNQLDAQLIVSILRQPLHVSGVSRPIIRRYNLEDNKQSSSSSSSFRQGPGHMPQMHRSL
jgi:hypothetical protein